MLQSIVHASFKHIILNISMGKLFISPTLCLNQTFSFFGVHVLVEPRCLLPRMRPSTDSHLVTQIIEMRIELRHCTGKTKSCNKGSQLPFFPQPEHCKPLIFFLCHLPSQKTSATYCSIRANNE